MRWLCEIVTTYLIRLQVHSYILPTMPCHTDNKVLDHKRQTCEINSTLWDVKFLQQCCWRLKSSGIWHCVAGWGVPDVQRIIVPSSWRSSNPRRLLELDCLTTMKMRHYVTSRRQESLVQQQYHIPEVWSLQHYVGDKLMTKRTHTNTSTHLWQAINQM
jgi:hypothetical protein